MADHDDYDPKFCKKSVRAPGTWPRFNQCKKKTKRDGYCTIHHPDGVEKRNRERDRRFELDQKKRRERHTEGTRLRELQEAVETILPVLERDSYKVLAAALKKSHG